MNVATIKKIDISNGDGCRVSLYVSGCRMGCKKCFNKEAWDFNYGYEYDDNVKSDIINSLRPTFISGLSILGGDPLEPENWPTVYQLIKAVRKEYGKTKTIYLWTGRIIEDIDNEDIIKMLLQCDIVVDGPFKYKLFDPNLKMRGSSNQRLLSPKDIKQILKNKEVAQ